jgi:Aerotolerance regulator N-terminal
MPDESLVWLNPVAWWGLVAIAVPVIIHLVARHRGRRLLFPSLKFIPTAPMAALRRREITEWPLLIVRIAIVTIATAALAGPVLVSSARRADWNQRVVRATVSTIADEGVARDRIAGESRSSFLHAHLSAAHLPDAIRDAVSWMKQQPPAARELVVIGDLREGLLLEPDLDLVPSSAGLRFVAVDDGRTGPLPRPRLVADDGSGRTSVFDLEMEASLLSTAVKYAQTTGAEPRVTIDGGAAQQAHADAVLRAVLREGVLMNSDRSHEVVIAFDGSTLGGDLKPPGAGWMRDVLESIPEARGGEQNGALIVRVSMPVTDRRAAGIVAQIVRRAFAGSFDALEPRRLSPATLAAWSRSPGPSPDNVLPADEGDRRWFWAAVLLLLAVEHLLRRDPKVSGSEA